MEELFKLCPGLPDKPCGKKQVYSCKWSLDNAAKKNTKCNSCAKLDRPPCSVEHRMKIGIGNKGKIPWNKGQRGLQTAWNKGTTGIMVAWNKGIPATDEQKKIISVSLTGITYPNRKLPPPFTQEHLHNMSLSRKGKKRPSFSKEWIDNIAKSSAAFKKGQTPWNKGKSWPDEWCKVQSDKKRIYTDESRYLVKNQRGHFRHWLNGTINGFEDVIGHSLIKFKAHIERHWLEGMNWDNYGKVWHIDHTYPLSSPEYNLKNEDDVKKLWHWDNLRPLWKSDNLSKGSKPHPSQAWFQY